MAALEAHPELGQYVDHPRLGVREYIALGGRPWRRVVSRWAMDNGFVTMESGSPWADFRAMREAGVID